MTSRLFIRLTVYKTCAKLSNCYRPARLTPDCTQGRAYVRSWLQALISFAYLGPRVNKDAFMLMKDGKSSAPTFASGENESGSGLGRGQAAGIGITNGRAFRRIAGREAAANARN